MGGKQLRSQYQPSVSICVPTHNYGHFLPDCIESILAQTFPDWELVIVDDCSDDTTAEIVHRYARADSRVRYLRNERRLGMNANLQRVAGLGRGRYLKILCADDWLAPKCLQVLFDLMENHPQVVLGTCAEIHCDEWGNPLRKQFLFGKSLSLIPGRVMLDRMASIQGFGGNSSFFIRSSAYSQVGGYDPAVRYAGDWELGARLCRVGDYLHTDEALFYGRSHSASSSSNDPQQFLDVIDRFIIPARTFRPRRFMNREWRRYRKAKMLVTAQGLVNAGISYVRGRPNRARDLLRLVRRYGDLPTGLLYAPIHAWSRLYGYLAARPTSGTWMPPETGMARPSGSKSRGATEPGLHFSPRNGRFEI